jgi:hypothetical protein
MQTFKTKQEKLIAYHEDRDRLPRPSTAAGGAPTALAPGTIASAWETASSSSFTGTPVPLKRMQQQVLSTSPGP